MPLNYGFGVGYSAFPGLKRTNGSVLDVIKLKTSLQTLATGQKLRYFGHLIRGSESLEKELMLGKTSGNRRRRRTRTRWLEEIKTTTQLNWTELLATAQDRKKLATHSGLSNG
jgi:hypothetical protein